MPCGRRHVRNVIGHMIGVADDATNANLPVVLDFDPGSLALTAYGRIHGGTAYGDRALADRYRSLSHSI